MNKRFLSLFKKYNMEDIFLHSYKTAIIASNISTILGYTKDIIEEIEIGCLVHDIGKINISKEILFKKERLNKSEFEYIKAHPLTGYSLVKNIKSDIIKDIVKSHHEKNDGSGYPYGIKEISEIVQIVTVSDMYESLRHKRSYKEAYSYDKSLNVLKENVSKNKINKKIVEIIGNEKKLFEEIVEDKGYSFKKIIVI